MYYYYVYALQPVLLSTMWVVVLPCHWNDLDDQMAVMWYFCFCYFDCCYAYDLMVLILPVKALQCQDFYCCSNLICFHLPNDFLPKLKPGIIGVVPMVLVGFNIKTDPSSDGSSILIITKPSFVLCLFCILDKIRSGMKIREAR